MYRRAALGLLFALSFSISVSASANPTTEQPDRKFNPGHYIALAMADDGATAIRRAVQPGVAGVEKRYTWRQLEPRMNEYDFSAIAADLLLMEALDMQLVVFVMDKSFRNEHMTPAYLWARYTLPIRSAKPGKGYVAKRWDPFVIERMNRLIEEIGRQFDANPRFEGLALQESALGIDSSILDREGYTPAVYRDALVNMLANARRALPRSQVFWYMNYLPHGQSLLSSVCESAARDAIAIGGPDVLPDSEKLRKHVYPHLRKQRGSTILFTSAQYDSFRHKRRKSSGTGKYWSPLEIFEFARDQLGVQYLFWNDVQRPRPADSYGIADALPVIAAHPAFNVSRQLADATDDRKPN